MRELRELSMGTRQKISGLLVMIASICAFFAWGLYFEVFGHPIVANFKTVGFFTWVIFGVFGIGLALGGSQSGLRYVAAALALLAFAFLIGIARGAYG